MQVALNSLRYMCALIKQSRYVNVSSEALLSVVWKSRERLGVREKYMHTKITASSYRYKVMQIHNAHYSLAKWDK